MFKVPALDEPAAVLVQRFHFYYPVVYVGCQSDAGVYVEIYIAVGCIIAEDSRSRSQYEQDGRCNGGDPVHGSSGRCGFAGHADIYLNAWHHAGSCFYFFEQSVPGKYYRVFARDFHHYALHFRSPLLQLYVIPDILVIPYFYDCQCYNIFSESFDEFSG